MIAVNLRPSVTALAPLSERMHEAGMSRQAIGMLTTMPLVLFGLAGVFVGAIGNRIGFARALGVGLVLLSAGCFFRSSNIDSGASFTSILGAILIGTGIAFGNVLLPGIVKSRFPSHVGSMTSLYSTAMNLGGTLGIALAVPLANSLSGGWQASLSSWGYAALIPLVIWLPQLFKEPNVRSQKSLLGGIVGLMRNRRAWQVTAHMGLQSLLFYSSVAWLPTVLQLRGMSESEAAAWPTAMQICGCVASLIIPTLASRVRNQSGWAAACGFTSAISIVGILWMPQAWVGLATIGLGLGLNAGFSLSLLLIAMRSNDAETAGNLSSMAQTFGYLVAAPFPWFIGWLSTATGSWTVAYVFLVIPALAVALAGALAGRAGFVR
ncbi:MAG: CP family cyanate transporter-like MFS transporter [Verrucomicrobiales bacterium]